VTFVTDGGLVDGSELCLLPSDSGPCYNYSWAYFYNPLSSRCEEFVYGGCSGNANRFTSVSECEQRCIYLETVTPMTTTTTTRSTQATMLQLKTTLPLGGETVFLFCLVIFGSAAVVVDIRHWH